MFTNFADRQPFTIQRHPKPPVILLVMKFSILATVLLFTAVSAAPQSVWNRQHLDSVKANASRPMYAAAINRLVAEADSLLDVTPLSVVDKPKAAPDGDRHNYVSLARYFHPNPATADSLPYIERDGVTNPEINLYDRNHLGATAGRVATLALARYLTGDERYAAKAAELLRVWFLDEPTRMNPNFEYAQMIPGVNGGKGRCYGVLDGYSFVELLDAVALLDGSEAWTADDNRGLKQWMGEMLDWLLTSPQGVEERRQANNHSTACDAQIIALALYTGRDDVARQVISEVPARRIFTQIEPDGSQPHEMWRTLSYGYSQYNLTHLIDIFMMADKLGMKIHDATNADGRNFFKAIDRLASYLGRPAEDWPGKQISGWEEKQQAVARDLWRVGAMVDTTRRDYRKLYRKYRVFDPSDRFTLLYYTPDATDDAFTNAAAALDRAVAATLRARHDPDNLAGHRVNPRSVNADGSVSLVHPHDWTSGFFPGELWMMYQFTNDPRWRREADSFSRAIEECKTHSGTHDLGFMIGDSFGRGYALTGDSTYFDVIKTACETLITRYNPAVGAIRSWDHNAEVWKYPVIIDNLMNLEMLFEMSSATGDPRYADIAVSHADKTLANHFRPDEPSSWHVVDYDPATGDARMKVTAQGYSDSSIWSRGQAWGLYGYTTCYRFTGDKRYLDHARAIADWFPALPNMPSDGIPYWDMKAPGAERPDNPDVPRDASAAAVFASGLYELAGYVDADSARRYRSVADRIVDSLTENYTLDNDPCGFILGHSTGHFPAGSEIDVPLVYADYYYLEAHLRRHSAGL